MCTHRRVRRVSAAGPLQSVFAAESGTRPKLRFIVYASLKMLWVRFVAYSVCA
ncbi:MAG: hypothetical protein IPK82_34010 [Polyangiaceae bacterium]|nr:hypothetical protein [Polyangiaceae bacterium]